MNSYKYSAQTWNVVRSKKRLFLDSDTSWRHVCSFSQKQTTLVQWLYRSIYAPPHPSELTNKRRPHAHIHAPTHTQAHTVSRLNRGRHFRWENWAGDVVSLQDLGKRLSFVIGRVATAQNPPFCCYRISRQWEKKQKTNMAYTVISVKLPPHIDPTKARLAYGDRALPKLVRN